MEKLHADGKQPLMVISKNRQLSFCRQMVLVKTWLRGKLEEIEANCQEAVLQQQLEMRSRLGPELVIFDIDFSSTARLANDRLSVRSQGSFNTIKANVCVYGGRWMYEVIKSIHRQDFRMLWLLLLLAILLLLL